jgi:hypothetical protein
MNKQDDSHGSFPDTPPPDVRVDATRSKTPMYAALNAERYHRQELIRSIQVQSQCPLICYVAGKAAAIERDDVVGFVDLLHNVPKDANLDLLLHTPGGDIDAAEKLITIVQTSVGVGRLRVIVPDFAKSAGTLMALGADTIIMSDTSELGPIDPQIRSHDGHGCSVQFFLDAYETHSTALRENPDNAAARIMLGKFDPARVKQCEATRDRARSFAEKQLRSGMFRLGQGNITEVAGHLLNTRRWLSHGQMIGWQDASQIGLLVEYLDPKSDEWRSYWKLYCLQRLAVKNLEKLFESDHASMVLEGSSY